MNIEQLENIAKQYDIPSGALLEAAGFIDSIQQIPKQTRREKLHELKRQRKNNQDDAELWAQEFVLKAKQAHAKLRTTGDTVDPKGLFTHPAGKQPDQRKNIAITALAKLWEQYHGPMSLYAGSKAMLFIMAALDAAIEVRIMEPETVRERLRSIRK